MVPFAAIYQPEALLAQFFSILISQFSLQLGIKNIDNISDIRYLKPDIYARSHFNFANMAAGT